MVSGTLGPERLRSWAPIGRPTQAALLAAVLLTTVLTGCGSGTVPMPDRTVLPSISLPARPTALPSLPQRTATETATATATTTVTAQQSRPAASAAPSSSAPASVPTETEASNGLGWWWLVWLVVVAGLVGAGIWWWRRRTAAKEIDRRFGLVRSELAWADDDLLPRLLATPSTSEAAQLWQAGRPRLLVVEEELRQLAVAATGQDPQEQAKQWRSALASLVTSVDAETSLPSGADSERLRAARAKVEDTRRDLRTLLSQEKPDAGPATPR